MTIDHLETLVPRVIVIKYEVNPFTNTKVMANVSFEQILTIKVKVIYRSRSHDYWSFGSSCLKDYCDQV